MAARKKPKRTSGKRNTSAPRRAGRKYSPAELFMAGVGALLIILVLGIVITSIFGG